MLIHSALHFFQIYSEICFETFSSQRRFYISSRWFHSRMFWQNLHKTSGQFIFSAPVFVVPFSSRSQVVIKMSSNDIFLFKMINHFVLNLHFEWKMVSFDVGGNGLDWLCYLAGNSQTASKIFFKLSVYIFLIISLNTHKPQSPSHFWHIIFKL